MVANIKAIEVEGEIDEHGQLCLNERLPAGPGHARVIVLIQESDDPDEQEWLRAGTTNPALSFLANPEEDIYTLADGQPFNDER